MFSYGPLIVSIIYAQNLFKLFRPVYSVEGGRQNRPKQNERPAGPALEPPSWRAQKKSDNLNAKICLAFASPRTSNCMEQMDSTLWTGVRRMSSTWRGILPDARRAPPSPPFRNRPEVEQPGFRYALGSVNFT